MQLEKDPSSSALLDMVPNPLVRARVVTSVARMSSSLAVEVAVLQIQSLTTTYI